MGVVEAPVRDRCTRYAGREEIGCAYHGHQRHVAAVTPAPHADAGGVDVGQAAQVLDALHLVLDLDAAHAAVERRLEGPAAVAGAAVVEHEHHEALLREVLAVVATPGALHALHAGTAVDLDDDRVALRRIEAERLQHRPMHHLSVGGAQRAELGRAVRGEVGPIRMTRVEPVRDQHARGLAGRVAQGQRGRRVGRREGVEPTLRIGGHRHRVPARAVGEAADAGLDARIAGLAAGGAGERRRVQMPLDGRVAVGGEIDEPTRFIDALDGALARITDHHPLARGDRPQQLALEIVEIEVLVAAAVGRPDEGGLAREEGELVVQLHPGVAALLEQLPRRAGGRVDLQQRETLLVTRLALHGECARIREPRHAREVTVAGCGGRQLA